MARSDDKKGDKRGSSPPKAEGGSKKKSGANAASGGTPPAAPKKKAPAARPAQKGPKAAGATPPTRRTSPPTGRAATAKPATPKAAGTAKPAGTKPAAAKAAAAKPAAPRKRASARKPERRGPPEPAVLDEEQRIEDAKYQPRDLPRRLFEEERFIFPDSYGQSRIRLLVKDPDWLFAHWDVDPQSLADLRAELGERASALSTLTLRVSDPQHGGESRVLLPDGARSWYVRADTMQRSYRAELGLTLPSGEFRSLAQSNTVTTPRTGPARTGGPRRMRYDGAAPPEPAAAPPSPATRPAAGASPADPGPWRPDPSSPSYPGPTPGGVERAPEGRGTARPGEPSGGASDVYRR